MWFIIALDTIMFLKAWCRKSQPLSRVLSGNTRLQAKYKPEKHGSTSHRVTQNKALWLEPAPPPFFICTCERVKWLPANRCRTLAHCFSWPPSPFPWKSHSVSLFSGRRGLKLRLCDGSCVPEFMCMCTFDTGCQARSLSWLSRSYTTLICGANSRQLSYLRLRTLCAAWTLLTVHACGI